MYNAAECTVRVNVKTIHMCNALILSCVSSAKWTKFFFSVLWSANSVKRNESRYTILMRAVHKHVALLREHAAQAMVLHGDIVVAPLEAFFLVYFEESRSGHTLPSVILHTGQLHS